MGGSGSGRIFLNKKLTVEDGLTLNINRMGFLKNEDFLTAWKENKEIISANGNLHWTRKSDKKEIASIGYKLTGQGEAIKVTLIYCHTRNDIKTEIEEPILLSSTPHNGNGLRFWFLCPLVTRKGICHNRVSKLYLPNGAKYFGCRECYNLTYTSCQESHKFDGLHKLLARQIGCGLGDVKEALKRGNLF